MDNALSNLTCNDLHRFRLYVEKRVMEDDLPYLIQSVDSLKTMRISFWRRVTEIWKVSKGTAVYYLVLSPLGLIIKSSLSSQAFFRNQFEKSNEALKNKLPKVKNEKQRQLTKMWIELNDLGIKRTDTMFNKDKVFEELNAAIDNFTVKPTLESFKKLLDLMDQFYYLCEECIEVTRRKADKQDEINNYAKSLSKLDRRDLEDFVRATLTDMAVSIHERKATIIATPIEAALKSGKIAGKIEGFLLMTPSLRVAVKLEKSYQQERLKWIKDLSLHLNRR